MARKRLTRKKVNDPVVDTALRDIYDKIEHLMPETNGKISKRAPQIGDFQLVNNGDQTSLAQYTEEGWMVDMNSNYTTTSNSKDFRPSVGSSGKSRTPVKGEAVKYDRNKNIAITNDKQERILLNNTGNKLNIKNANDSSNIQLEIGYGGTGASTADTALDNLGGTTVGKNVFKAVSESAARSAISVDAAGTDNSTPVTFADGAKDYLSLSGQEITVGLVDLSDNVTGLLPKAGVNTSGTWAASDIPNLSADKINADTFHLDRIPTIPNTKLQNDSISLGGVSVDLGSSDATPAFDLQDSTNTNLDNIKSGSQISAANISDVESFSQSGTYSGLTAGNATLAAKATGINTTSNGFVKTGSGDGTVSISSQIDLTSDVTGTLPTTNTAAKVTEVDGNTGAVTAANIRATALTDATAGQLSADKAIIVDSNKAISNMVVSRTYPGTFGPGTYNLIEGTAIVDSTSAGSRTVNGISINLDKTSGNTTGYTMNVMDLQVNGSSKLKVNDTGAITSTGTAENTDASSGDNRYLHITSSGEIGYRTAATIKGDIGGTAASSTFTDVTINGTDGNTALQITSSADTGDLFKITTNAHGATTIETEDNDATAAHLTLDVDGDIALDSASGNFIAKRAGTEFSVANSAYAGMILGYTRIANDGTASVDNLIALTSSMTVLETNHNTRVSVVFTAPPSGNVEIQFSCRLYTNSTTVAFALSSAGLFSEVDETHTYDAGAYRMDETDVNTININWAVTGLTPGVQYTYFIAGKETSGSTATIAHGRFRTGGQHYPPILVKAVALPATITTAE